MSQNEALPGETSAPLEPAQCAHGRMRCELEVGHTGQHRRGKYDWNNHENGLAYEPHPDPRITEELIDQITRTPYTGPNAHCPWDAVDLLTRILLRTRVIAFLEDALPALEDHGWTPPPEEDCPHCHGTGQHILRVKRIKGETEYIHDGVQCPHCKGTGDTP